ncbi:unnamed protein product, partial [Brachionus calyciflorus]
MEPLSFDGSSNNPYNEKLKRKKQSNKNKVVGLDNFEQNEIDQIKNNENNAFIIEYKKETNKESFEENSFQIQDSNILMPLPPERVKSQDLLEKVTSDKHVYNNNIIPSIPLPIKVNEIAKIVKKEKSRNSSNEQTKTNLSKCSKTTLILSLIIGILAVLVIVLLVLTIIFGVRNTNLNNTSTSSTPAFTSTTSLIKTAPKP